MEILDGKRNETNKIVFENHVYHQDYVRNSAVKIIVQLR